VQATTLSAGNKSQGKCIEVLANQTRERICDKLCGELDKATGTSPEVACRIALQMANSLVWPQPKDQTDALIKAIATLAEHAPRNAEEASLVVQMRATAEAGLMFLTARRYPNSQPRTLN